MLSHVGKNRAFLRTGSFYCIGLPLHLYHQSFTMSKTVLITGANGGLGTAVVQKFLDDQYTVIAVDRSEKGNSPFAKHPKYEHHAVNLTDETETNAFIATMISKHQQIDAALLLVGGFAMGNIENTDGEALQKMYSLNFETAYFISRPLFSHMHQRKYGRIVFVGARPALEATAGKDVVAYALSKSLLFSLAEMMNATAKGTDVVSSVIVPSTIDTPANRKDMPKADTSKWVPTDQIADVLAFICSAGAASLREPVYKVYGNA